MRNHSLITLIRKVEHLLIMNVYSSKYYCIKLILMKVLNIEELTGQKLKIRILIFLDSINNGLIKIMKHIIVIKKSKRVMVDYIHILIHLKLHWREEHYMKNVKLIIGNGY